MKALYVYCFFVCKNKTKQGILETKLVYVIMRSIVKEKFNDEIRILSLLT